MGVGRQGLFGGGGREGGGEGYLGGGGRRGEEGLVSGRIVAG